TGRTYKQRYKVEELLQNNANSFATKISKIGQTVGLGQTNLVCYEIPIDDAKPIKQCPYYVLPDKNKFLKDELEQIQEKEVIRKTRSPWTS
ncbi:4822_t:CDS:1, partial [Gigaspora rosea]